MPQTIQAPNTKSISDLPRIMFTPAPGNHFFIYKRRLVWLTRERQQANKGNEKNEGSWSRWKKETFTLRIFGRSQDVARKLLEDARSVSLRDRENKVEIYVSCQGWWARADSRDPRPLSTVFLPHNTAENIAQDVQEFLHSREWYITRGIPYRRGYLFYGVPGSGKTSLIVALASRLSLHLYVLSLSDVLLTDSKLNELLANVPPRSMVLLEDIDAAFHERLKSDVGGITFSGLLNALDGAASKEGNIVFMTTNHFDRLDPALIRPGRADVHLHFDYATAEQAEKMFRGFYEVIDDMQAFMFAEHVANNRMSMAEVQNHLLRHKTSPESAVSHCRIAA